VKLLLPGADNAQCQVYRGSLSPIFGWVSREFRPPPPGADGRLAARALAGNTVLRTEILIPVV